MSEQCRPPSPHLHPQSRCEEEQQPLWKSLQQLVDHQPEEQRLVIQKRLVGREELSGGSVGRAATVECRGEGTKDDLNRRLLFSFSSGHLSPRKHIQNQQSTQTRNIRRFQTCDRRF